MLAVAVGWGLLVAVAAWLSRPAPARVRALVPAPTEPARPRIARATGRVLRRAAGRSADHAADERLGRSVLAGVAVGLVVSPALGLLVGSARWSWPLVRRRRQQRDEAQQVVDDLPDLIDLLGVAVGAGLTVPLALAAVGPRLSGPLAGGVHQVVGRTQLGLPRAEALELLCVEVGEVARPLVAALQGAERYGTPLVPVLERLAAEARLRRRRHAEAAARRVPVRLLFPLVLCTLPAFALLTVVPLLAGSLSSLRP